ncbi:crotonase/enoyl-CoA hydratase family protein [Camelimonas abortus]|uniref:Crotonase/enoyl-CoA hydratase family protein n=1 Tax=Camelimonas abortus TaxID=1017184 RepID=A0ABV7LFL6_9HYPH
MSAVEFKVEDGVAIITLNRPEAKNAVNGDVARGVAAAVDEINSRDDIRLAILTGAGGSFCAGMDLKAFVKGEVVSIEGRGFAGLTEAPPKKPLIAAVEGYALAGGCELALTCDLIVASEGSKFGIPEVKRGLVAAAGGLMRLPRQIPYRIAMELALTGEMVSAATLQGYGLINRVVPNGQALEEALTLARVIAGNGPLAVAVSRQIINEQQDWSAAEMWEKQKAYIEPVFKSHDAREGAIAFAEKRKPVWTGK